MIKFLFEGINFQGGKTKDSARITLLKNQLATMMKTPDFLNQSSEFIPVIGHQKENYINVTRHLKLRVSEQVMMALAAYRHYVRITYINIII